MRSDVEPEICYGFQFKLSTGKFINNMDAWCILTSFSFLIACAKTSNVGKPIEVTEDNWRETLSGEWMVEFMAPWCPACQSFQETWESFAKWGRDLDVKVGIVDVTQNPGLSGRFFVTALPTIYHIKDGVFRQYVGSRSENDLIGYVDDKKWTDYEPVSAVWNPNSIQMSTVSWFFKIAMMIRSFYNTMVSEYGIPEWGCYLIFAVMTIIAGLILGLIIVCCCDFMYPPKYQQIQVPNEAADNQDDDILDDTKPNPDADGDAKTVRQRHVEKSDEQSE
ncbi:thioredoxin-related transmembrane protein 1-like [Gigantopelta aegis]|uniref:thioredoxin-related transmembrane protein 1-like n=1 Tax=Gigantopelta aegis TaxID=1735272 RepID=UPI001B88967B|nr:thioredoxin-related transmembrane protein 1-like [Gigantopelta aegis]